MSTRVPNWYTEALRPDWAFAYCGPLSVKSRYAVASSRGVNVSRALGFTTTLMELPRLLRTDHHQLRFGRVISTPQGQQGDSVSATRSVPRRAMADFSF